MRQKHLIYALVFSCLLGSCIALIAFSEQNVEGLRAAKDNAYNRLYNIEIPRHAKANDLLNEMIRSVKRKYNTLTGISVNTAPAGDPFSLTHRGVSAVSVIRKSYTLSDSLKESLINMENQRTTAENLWDIDVANAFSDYENAVAAFNTAVSPNERIEVSDPIKPHVESLYDCQGPCYTAFETLPLAMYSHLVSCSEKHGSSGQTKSYWSCEYNVCPGSNSHWWECRASSCTVLFPPPEHEHEYDYYDHKVKCSESVYSVIPGKKCGAEYFTCEHSTCPERNTHWSGSTPPPSPSYHACGVHETSVSGDHSLQASCSASNANGSCTVSGFYACDGHSHVYPSPPDPPTIVCPAHSWTGCGGTFSHEKTCGSGHTYYTCNPSAVSWHTAERTCSRTGCNATYTDCSRGSETKHCLGKYKWHK